MFQSEENVQNISESCDSTESSETPSELEARLYSVLHYNDLSEPLPPDLASNYSVSVSGADVCISVIKTPGNKNKGMAEELKDKNDPNQQASSNAVSSHENPSNLSRSTTINGSITKLSSNLGGKETVGVTSRFHPTKNDLFGVDLNSKLPAYVSYLTWVHQSGSHRQLIRDTVRNLPHPPANPTSYTACKKVVQEHADHIDSLKRRLREEELPIGVLKQIFSQFIAEACLPRNIPCKKAVSEFVNYLSPKNTSNFQQHCVSGVVELFSNIDLQFANRKEIVKEILLKKFKIFLDKDFSQSKLECVEKFRKKVFCLSGESMLATDVDFEEQLFAAYEIHRACNKQKVVVQNARPPHLTEQEDSSEDSGDDVVPLKKRKLDDGKAQVSSQKDTATVTSNEVRNLLSKCSPKTSDEEVLRRIFNRFHEFSLKEKCQGKKHKFIKVFAKFKRSSDCFNTLYCGLIDDSLFRELFIFGNQNPRITISNAKTVGKVESLVRKALATKSLGKLKEQPKPVPDSVRNNTSPGVLSKANLTHDVITLSSDESDVEIMSRLAENDNSSSSSGNVWINAQNSSCPVENQSISEESRLLASDDSSSKNLHSGLEDNRYASSCPPSWSREMIEYYCVSWGGETFHHSSVLKELKATTRPSDWKVTNREDLIPSNKRKRGKQCNRCLQWGHIKDHCKEPSKPVVCSTCGGYNHSASACNDKKCFRCGVKTSKFMESCQVCRGPTKCTLCDSDKHDCSFCPDTWRSYHLTVGGSVNVPPELEMNPRQYCCNCGKAGHLDYFCPSLRKSTTLNTVNNPFVLSYGVENMSARSFNQSNVPNALKHRANSFANTPRPQKARHTNKLNQRIITPYKRSK